MNMRRNFFIESGVRHWKGLLRKAMESPALEVSKECAQSSGLSDKMGIDHRLGSVTLGVFSNVNHAMKSLWLLSQLCSRTAPFLPVAQQPTCQPSPGTGLAVPSLPELWQAWSPQGAVLPREGRGLWGGLVGDSS